jgi:hypothetical protein
MLCICEPHFLISNTYFLRNYTKISNTDSYHTDRRSDQCDKRRNERGKKQPCMKKLKKGGRRISEDPNIKLSTYRENH